MIPPSVELAEIISRYGSEFIERFHPSGYHKGVLYAIKSCRTAILGGHIDQCDDCNRLRISYNSCRNRHCPKCQGLKQLRWVLSRKEDLLPVRYFHMVFTIPDVLNTLCLNNPDVVYDVLFRSVRDTLFAFAADPRHLGAEIGFITVLHTWGQNLSLHPHLHCLIPSGGITVDGKWKNARSNGDYLFPVKALSTVFRGKFRDELKKASLDALFEVSRSLLAQMHQSKWVVYAKEPFAGPQQVIEYLGRYTHRVAISNHRLVKLEDDHITFLYKDYRDNNRKKPLTLDAVEFLRRFCHHILPRRFVRIRHYGILSSRRKAELSEFQGFDRNIQHRKDEIRKMPWEELCRIYLNVDPQLCPYCHKGRMKTISIIPARSPPKQLSTIKSVIAIL